MNPHLIAIAPEPDEPLQSLLEQALMSSTRQRDLLHQPELLGQILSDIPARQWLFEVSLQTENPRRSGKARLLIILIMQHSGKIWRGMTDSLEDYDEALAQTWKWFSEKFQTYAPEQASFITWFNQKLKYLILDVKNERQRRKEQSLIDLNLPDPKSSRIEVEIFYEQILELVRRDPEHYLHKCRMQRYAHVTCQNLILGILQTQPTSPNIPWEALTDCFEVNPKSLRDFYNRTALPHFRRFCHCNGIYFP